MIAWRDSNVDIGGTLRLCRPVRRRHWCPRQGRHHRRALHWTRASWAGNAPMHSTRTAVLAMLVALLLPTPAVRAETAPPDRSNTAGLISAELAKKCRALAIKAHPTERAGSRDGAYAQTQRDYFQDCIAKGGNMPD